MIAKEERFHDAWAKSETLEDIQVAAAFEAATALENRFILSQMGDLRGKRLLDIGAGLGESSVRFAQLGAEVTATDVSPGMLDLAAALAHRHGVAIKTIHCPGEKLVMPDAAFDFIYVANTIHHVTRKDALFSEMRRVLRPGGRFYSWDPLKYNPIINVYRRLAGEVRTPDERPLGISDLRRMRRFFPDTQARHFWLLTQAIFLKYFLLDRVDPNQHRYWKRIYGETERSLRWWLPLRRADELLTRLPGVRWLAWNVVLWGTKTTTA